jgi:hypothetical protein
VILGFDGSRDQNVFVAQKGLESKVDTILNRISQMQRISCSGSQLPVVRVSVVANTPSGPVEAFDFAEYQPELFEKFQNMQNQHPYILTADTLKVYQNKFRQASPENVKVSGLEPFPGAAGVMPIYAPFTHRLRTVYAPFTHRLRTVHTGLGHMCCARVPHFLNNRTFMCCLPHPASLGVLAIS